jgi:hypothetical protein
LADPYFANVVLLVGNESGADGGTTFLDQSSAAQTITAVGNIQWDDQNVPASLTTWPLLDGNGDYLKVNAAASLVFGTGDLTIEGFFRTDDITVGAFHPLVDADAADGLTGGWFHIQQVGQQMRFGHGGAERITANNVFTSTTTTYHWALTRSGGTSGVVTLWVAGSSVGTYSIGTGVLGETGRDWYLGAQPAFARFFDGWGGGALCRVTGVCRYTGNFTPPTLPLPTSATDPAVDTPVVVVPNFAGGKRRKYKWGVPYIPRFEAKKKALEEKVVEDEQKVEAVQQKIEVKQRQIYVAPSKNAGEDLTQLVAQLHKLQARQVELLASLMESKRQLEAVEEEEALAVYLLYRSLH